ncbi:MAG: hypothetical protein MZU91_02255 [Desulfosudis oleivorans]|nr:hypothetical protein [Desulfosudis oleivorans]
MPRLNGCEAGNAPSPSRVLATGVWVLTANCINASSALRHQHAMSAQDDRALRLLDQLDGLLQRVLAAHASTG